MSHMFYLFIVKLSFTFNKKVAPIWKLKMVANPPTYEIQPVQTIESRDKKVRLKMLEI